MRRTLLAAVALALLILAGCRGLNYEKDFTLEVGGSRTFTISAPRGDQKVTVKATSSKEPITILVTLADSTKELLGEQKNAKEISFEVTVPAGKEFIVTVFRAPGGGGATDVKLSVKGH